MKNIPVFATENGVATLILKEIPYYQTAYVKIQDTQTPKELLEECKNFCRMVGAEAVYASGHEYLEQFPLHTEIWNMCISRASLPDTEASLMPVTEETMEQWRAIYNKRMSTVPNASYMTTADAKEYLAEGHGYFVHQNGELLGIGIAYGNRIEAVASVKHGSGKNCILALNHALAGDEVCLDVASSNFPAIKLYESFGFIKTSVISSWYQIV